MLQVPRKRCFVYDPVFTSTEKVLVGDLVLQLLPDNEVRFTYCIGESACSSCVRGHFCCTLYSQTEGARGIVTVVNVVGRACAAEWSNKCKVLVIV